MDEPRFFCLRGFMKSGTNWVGSLLSSHESVSCVGEFHWQYVVRQFNRDLQRLPIYEDPGLRNAARDNLEAMIRQTMIAAAEPGAKVIGDRTPHTLVPITLRNTPHICVYRDGRDILVSRAFHLFNFPEVARPLFQRSRTMAESLEAFREDPWYFQKHPERLLACDEMVRTSLTWWRDQIREDFAAQQRYPHLPVLMVQYEAVHADTEGQRRRMFEFLGVDPKRAASLTGVLKPGFDQETPQAFLRKGAVGDWQNYFTDRTRQLFREIAGQTLIDLGYVQDEDW